MSRATAIVAIGPRQIGKPNLTLGNHRNDDKTHLVILLHLVSAFTRCLSKQFCIVYS